MAYPEQIQQKEDPFKKASGAILEGSEIT